MRLAIKMDCQGNLTDLDLDSTPSSYDILREAVEGMIAPVDLDETLTMYVGDENLYSRTDQNPLASMFMARAYGEGYVNGPAVFTGGLDDSGDTLGLTMKQKLDLSTLIEQIRPQANMLRYGQVAKG